MSQAVIHGNTAYLAGSVARDPEGKDVAAQTKDILEQIDATLAQAGTDKTKLLSATIWLSDISTFDQMNKVWDGWVSQGNTPARATVEAKLAAPRFKVEIGVIAAVWRGGRGASMRAVVLGLASSASPPPMSWRGTGTRSPSLDRLAEPASETSFANAGLIAPGHAYTWSSPRAPGILWRSLFDESQALRFKPSLDPRLWDWTLKFLRNCTAARARVNTKRKVRLCIYSQGELQRISAETGVPYHELRGGLLYLYRSPQSFERGASHTRILSEEGLELRTVDRDEMARIDPALEPVKEQFAGAVFARATAAAMRGCSP